MEGNSQVITDIESWVLEYGDALFDWAYYKTSKREIAEDLVQDTFLAALQKGNKFRGESSPKSWLLKILNNKIIDYYRKSASQATVFTAQFENKAYSITESFFDHNDNWKATPESIWEADFQLLDDEDFNRVMAICLDDLPENWRNAISFKYLFSKEPKEICQELGVTMSNYWQVIHRAKLLLKKCLEVKYFNQL